MTKKTLKLKEIIEAKWNGKNYRIKTSEKGLYLFITQKRKSFRFEFFDEKQKRKTITLGNFPQISLADAKRNYLEIIEKLSAENSFSFQSERLKKTIKKNTKTFGHWAEEWLESRQKELTHKNYKLILGRIHNYLNAIINEPIEFLESIDIFLLLDQIQSTGKIETAHRVKTIISQIFRYSILRGGALRDITLDLRGQLKNPISKNWAYIEDPRELKTLLEKSKQYTNPAGSIYIQLLAHFFVRPGELRLAKKEDFDLKNKIWRVPPPTMKMKKSHLVPLTNQTIKLIKKALKINPKSEYLISSILHPRSPICENTPTNILRKMGYKKTEMTAHGFRATASTILHENGFDSLLIEKQLAHEDQNKIRKIYNHAQYFDRRKEMMEWWSNFLENL